MINFTKDADLAANLLESCFFKRAFARLLQISFDIQFTVFSFTTAI